MVRVEGFLAVFYLSACEKVLLDIKFVNEGECLTSWAVSPDITFLWIRQITVCLCGAKCGQFVRAGAGNEK